MWTEDPDAALARHQHREAARRRLRDSQRQDLLEAARVLIPDHGIAIPLARVAVHAGIPRHAAAALFNATTDLAVELVRRAWHALIEAIAPADTATPQDYVTRLIQALRADAPAHRIHHALCCGTPAWQREALTQADGFLALAIGEGLRAVIPAIPQDQVAAFGRRLLALARDVAGAPATTDTGSDAADILAMLAPLIARLAAPEITARETAAAAAIAAPPSPPTARRRPAPPAGGTQRPERAAVIRFTQVPSPPQVHDPPVHAA